MTSKNFTDIYSPGSVTSELATSDPMDLDEDEPKARAAASLRQILEGLLIDILNHGNPSVFLRRRPTKARFFINPGTGALEANGAKTATEAIYRFPGRDAHEAWRFSTVTNSTGASNMGALFLTASSFNTKPL